MPDNTNMSVSVTKKPNLLSIEANGEVHWTFNPTIDNPVGRNLQYT